MTDTEHRPTGSRVARIVPYAERKPLYAAYQAAREWAEKNGQSYTDDGIIQAAVKAYETAEIERLRAEVERYRDAVDHMLALAPDEYRQTIVAARAAGSSGDYDKNNGRAESIRLFATGLAERAGLPGIDWEQIKRDVPADGVYRTEATA